MKKTKKKEYKYLKQILIPCLSVAAVGSVAIPMSILCNKQQHVFVPMNQRDRYFKTPTITYKFILNQNLDEGQKIIFTTRKSPKFIFNNWLEPVSSEPIIPQDKEINVELAFRSLKAETEGRGAFDACFTCVDENNNIVWKDKIEWLIFKKLPEVE